MRPARRWRCRASTPPAAAVGRAPGQRSVPTAAAGMWTQRLQLSGDMARSGYRRRGLPAGRLAVRQRPPRWARTAWHRLRVRARAAATRAWTSSPDRNRSHSHATLAYVGWTQRALVRPRPGRLRPVPQDVSRQVLLGASWMPVSTCYDGSYRTAYGESGLHFGHGAAPGHAVRGRALRAPGPQTASPSRARTASACSRRRADAGPLAGRRRPARHAPPGPRRGRWLDVNAHAQWQHTLAARGDVFDASFVGVQRLAPAGRRRPVARQRPVRAWAWTRSWAAAATLNFGYDYADRPARARQAGDGAISWRSDVAVGERAR